MPNSIFVHNRYQNSFPYVHHCPLDVPEKIWHELVRVRGSSSQSLKKPSDLTIITFNNTKEKMLLEQRLDASNTEYVLLGKEVEKWTNPHKIELLKDYLPFVKTEFVLVLDCCDVVISSDLSNIINDFKTFNCNVLYNASSVIYPAEKHYSAIEETICDDFFNHLNSGCFIGYKDYCLDLYTEAHKFEDEITKEHHYSDQIRLKALYVKRYPEIKIDSKSKIFQLFHWKNMKSEDFIQIHTKI